MNDKELIHVANLIQEAMRQLRKGRYLECMRQLGLFTSRFSDLARDSRKLGLALSHNWLVASEHTCKTISRHLSDLPYALSKLESLLDRRPREVPSFAAIVAELRALQEEFDDVAFNGEEGALCVITDSITLEAVYLGRFRIGAPEPYGHFLENSKLAF